MTNTCETCDHFSRIKGGRHGECYRNPPTPFMGGFGGRPTVGMHDRACGWYDPNPNYDLPEIKTAEGRREIKALVASVVANGGATHSTAPSMKKAPAGKRSE